MGLHVGFSLGLMGFRSGLMRFGLCGKRFRV